MLFLLSLLFYVAAFVAGVGVIIVVVFGVADVGFASRSLLLVISSCFLFFVTAVVVC